MALLKGRKMVFKAFEIGIFSKLEESEQSEQSTDDLKYNSFGYDTNKLSKKLKDSLLENISNDLNDTYNTDNKLFTPIKEGTGLKILSLNQMPSKLPIALA